MKRHTSIALALSLGVMMGGLGIKVVEPRLPTSPTVRGLTIGGQPLPPQVHPVSWLQSRQQALAERRVVLRYGELRFETTLAELGVSLDVDDTAQRAMAVGHLGSVLRRLRETASAGRGEIDVPLAYHFDDAKARAHVEQYADELARDPVDAVLDLEGHRKVPDVSGAVLDLDATVAEIGERAVHDDELSLITRSVPAAVTMHDLGDIDVSQVLSSYETKFSVYKKGRSQNVALATSKLNGLIIRSGQTVSFNERVGPRTRKRGFQFAPEIQGDELTIGVGGGTCQVSSTFHAAAVYGGLGVVDRKSHSRPSGYTPLGLDATVAYGRVDLKVLNSYAFGVVVHAIIPEPGLLRVEILGGKAVADVAYEFGVGGIEEFARRITVVPHLKSGKFYRKQKGTRGMHVSSIVTLTYLDGRVEKRRYHSGYRATPEVFYVAPDYEPEKLPDLPKWAKGVESELARDGSDVYPTL